jgi:hypothetical protein
MSAPAESLVLVEGYDDRDFWKGLLLRRGCMEAKKEPPARHRQSPGFTYLTPSSTLIHVVPYTTVKSESSRGAELSTLAGLKLRGRVDKPLRRLVMSPDADTHATLDDARKSIRAIVTRACSEATETPEGDFLVDDGRLVVSALFVHADAAGDDPGQRPIGVPAQRALEQLVCAALCRVYPERGEAVGRWLASRPCPVGKDHKAHAWSFYAGWSTDHGTGDFYGSLWRDDRVAVELEDLLRAQHAWRVIEALLEP